MSACGSQPRQDAQEPTGNFPVSVDTNWTTSQTLSQHTQLVITIHNTGRKTIPDAAVTITDGDPSLGTKAQPFQELLHMPGLASQSRAVWIVDTAPDPSREPCPQNLNAETYTGSNFSACSGGPGGAVTAYSNTWALGSLRPGKSAIFIWHLTAVQAGTHVVNWAVAAGLNGKAKAVDASGGPPAGRFTVSISNAPQQSYVNGNGQIVTTP
ncbi:MAG: hypothetical protein JO023_14645 [Chloroflexi bacterium]|nr:hypothetical protein [Chloroflexota bacterium]